MNTTEIIDAIKSNERKKLMLVLYKNAFPPILNFFKKKRGSLLDAEDCFQEAIIVLIKKVYSNTYDNNYEVKNFLFVVSRNLWFNKLKRDARTSLVDINDLNIEDISLGIEDTMIGDERKAAIQQLMQKAGERCNQLLTLIMFENKKLVEVVKLMNFSSEDVVKTTHYRCKQKLKEVLQNDPQLLAQLTI